MQHGIMTPLKDMKRCVLPAPLEGMQQNQRPTAVSIHCKATAAVKAETIKQQNDIKQLHEKRLSSVVTKFLTLSFFRTNFGLFVVDLK